MSQPQEPSISRPTTARSRPTWRKVARVVVAAVLILLGALWTLQGTGILRIEPIMCVADCRPVTGGSAGWTVAGLVTLAIGLLVLLRPRRR
ncbi:hypothetical protein Sru01_27290 [Sphaerisporangium rufum]|uniref:Uncharacterized protein n=1 Tax=Sphaerisporangium rufum TaxID=1381558 RepID=A0A919R145_9ACTN|nr:hypothetical protein [Sphaerisporangium rufum]GII77747.1 hypothetical protein Sru01_27290 [Sphaerisporangium rufum]